MKSSEASSWVKPILIPLAFPLILAACDSHTEVAFKPKDPTHKLVCECTCEISGPTEVGLDTTVTVDLPSGGCGSLNGAKCRIDSREGKTKSCGKVIVPTALIQVQAVETVRQ